ncbi:uncharacterized protein LOC143901621 [Temnothorax americanus]|uniref:uncharacterized protein LOC143901621 n=1 Tax=Temnothorax americanus TaxID=1964332 RepID=UPI004067D690
MRPLKSTDADKNIEKRRLVEELHAPARRNFLRRHVIVRENDDLWQADIVEMRPYSRFNGGYHYILTVIDVLSKYAWAVPLKGKGGSETADAIAEIIRRSGSIEPSACDPSTLPPAKAKRLLATVYSVIKIVGPAKFKVGDSVRVSKYKKIFEKGYTPNWPTEGFKIVKVQRTNPVTYLLEDYRGKSVSGGFYEHELHRATYPDVYLVEKVLRRRGDEVYVK